MLFKVALLAKSKIQISFKNKYVIALALKISGLKKKYSNRTFDCGDILC